MHAHYRSEDAVVRMHSVAILAQVGYEGWRCQIDLGNASLHLSSDDGTKGGVWDFFICFTIRSHMILI